MARTNLRLLLAALVAVVAVPAIAQMGFSESYTFLKAVRERDGAKVDEITSNPSSTAINAREQATGDAALHIVVRRRDLSWLGFLLGRGARPDIETNDGSTPLMLAAQIGWREGAERLITGRANVNAANNRGETALIYAVQRNDLPMVRLLVSQGADPDQTDSVAGYSALDYARQDRRFSAVLQALQNPQGRPTTGQMMGPTQD
ncbi:ankyrin repeat domain-containing protein [Sphingosinicella sp. LHD-64]|uniref:ankyrin repeat domain-containing protein n=1 Tax=Sphingosinicella sp. LHD-64 TaxID=3072139 RepID=UPI00280D1CC8|nr:ankyrin repeat domain-containing protein [Sphingosinicella sp. LHD-64]MDQ8757014.1 ankyrin repeat domain-containing protein [Sphingosinicella sp. LHD-64]